MQLLKNILKIFSLSDLTKERIKKFKSYKRAYYSLIILCILTLGSFLSDWLVTEKPLVIKYDGKVFFPSSDDKYRLTDFGGVHDTKPNYVKLLADPEFNKKVDFIIRAPYSKGPFSIYMQAKGNPPYAPSWEHWLGTDEEGRDLLARLVHGFKYCMFFALILTGISFILGIIIGGIQGYFGGKIDFTFQRLIEVWSSLPFLYVVIVIGSIYGQGFWMLVVVMSLFSWVGLSYYMRGEFYKTKNYTFVKVAKAMGMSNTRIFLKHILPNALTPVVTMLPFAIMGGIASLTALDFLGFGLPDPTPSWGDAIKQGLKNIYAPWIAISTVAAMFFTLLLTAFVGEGVREAFDPKGGKS